MVGSDYGDAGREREAGRVEEEEEREPPTLPSRAAHLQIQIGEHASTPRASSLARATHGGTGEKASSPARAIPRRAHILLAAGHA